jgi:hypothetical protein
MKGNVMYKMKRHKKKCDVQDNDDNKKTSAKESGVKVVLDAMKRHELNCDVQDNDDNKKQSQKTAV